MASSAVAGLGHDLEALLAVEQQPQALANNGVVVGQDDLDLVGHRVERNYGREYGALRMKVGPMTRTLCAT